MHDDAAGGAGKFGRAVDRTIVADDDMAELLTRQGVEQRGQAVGFVKRRDDQIDDDGNSVGSASAVAATGGLTPTPGRIPSLYPD